MSKQYLDTEGKLRWFDQKTCSFCHSTSYHETAIAPVYEQWWHLSGYHAKNGSVLVGRACSRCATKIYNDLEPKFEFSLPYITQASWSVQLTVSQVACLFDSPPG